MNVLIAGCGYLGRALGTELLALRRSNVWGLCRSDASIQKLEEAGIMPLRGDMTDARTLTGLPQVIKAVVACQAPARGESYQHAYWDATQTLLRAVSSRSMRFLFISSTSVYGPRDGGWVDADTPIDPAQLDEDAQILRKTEEMVLSAPTPVKGMVLRLSGIYGPERNRALSIRSGRIRPTGGPAYTNRIHRDDAVRAIIRVLAEGTPGQTYLASDDVPATQKEFYGWLCPHMRLPVPPEPAAAEAAKALRDSKRCNSDKLKKLGWLPRYPSYKEGYGPLAR